VAALGIAGVFGARHLAARTLEPFEDPLQGLQPMATFRGEIERCQLHGGRLTVRGWIARPGTQRGRHATRVLLRNDADGRYYLMHTDLRPRADVNARRAAELHDGIDYTTSGFAAWVDLARAQPAVAGARIFIAYDEGDGRTGPSYVLVPTDCIAA
jgi:hypothetical protein